MDAWVGLYVLLEGSQEERLSSPPGLGEHSQGCQRPLAFAHLGLGVTVGISARQHHSLLLLAFSRS